jgi:ABC-type amino acid transport substrate-binding protein
VVDQELPGNPPRSAAVISVATDPGRRHALRLLGGVGLGAALAAPALHAQATPLDKLRERGTLVVGLYNEMPPFHVGGQGIDVAMAQGLADALALKLTMLPFNADEKMNDDLRNMVWRGHYLGFGPADVLLHVPVDKPLMDDNPRVNIFAPYYRERVVMARDLAKLPRLESLADLKAQPVAVPGQSLAGWLMIGADNGAYREQLSTQWKDGVQAAQALRNGEVAAAAGLASELESVLRGDARFAIEPLPMPRAPRDGWAVGCAVKKESVELARAIQQAFNDMAQSGAIQRAFAASNVAWRGA